MFEKVQAKLNEGNKKYFNNLGKYNKISSNVNIFKRKVMCGDCGKNVVRYKSAKKTSKKAFYIYICPTHSIFPDKCDFFSISENILKNIVMQSIKLQLSHLVDLENTLENALKRPEIRKKQSDITKNMSESYANISYIKESRIRLVSDYAKSLLCDEDYEIAKAEFDMNLDIELKKNEALEKEKSLFNKIFSSNIWICELKKYRNTKSITSDLVNIFISQIKVYPDKRINIKWTFQENYNEIVRFLEEGVKDAG